MEFLSAYVYDYLFLVLAVFKSFVTFSMSVDKYFSLGIFLMLAHLFIVEKSVLVCTYTNVHAGISYYHTSVCYGEMSI